MPDGTTSFQSWYNGLLQGRPAYGKYGAIPAEWYSSGNSGFINPATLPDYLRNQYEQTGESSEGGTGPGYRLAGGSLRDSQGHYVAQLGDAQGERLHDYTKVWYDPELGVVTDPANIIDNHGSLLSEALPYLAFFIGGPMLAGALGAAGAAGAVGSTAGEAALPGALTGISDAEMGITAMNSASAAEIAGTAGADGTSGFLGQLGTMDPVGAGTINAMDPATAGELAGASSGSAQNGIGPGASSSNFLSNANRVRQALGLGRNILGGTNGTRGRNGMSGFDMSSLLGLLGLGHNMFGNGVGTSQGAIDAGNRAADRADPWGASGRRGQFSDMMTPEYVQRMLSQDPSAIKDNPAYQFDLKQGTAAINMGDAAQGTLRSGNRGVELEQYGQGLASKYGQQYIDNNMRALGMMGNLAGVNAGSPTAAAGAITSAWDNSSNIRNSGMNGLFDGGRNNPLGGVLGLLGSGVSGLFDWLTNSGDLSSFLGGLGTMDNVSLPAIDNMDNFDISSFFG